MAKPKLALIPAAQGDKFYSVLPSDGVGDFDFTRNSSATRIAPTGFIQTVGAFGSELVTNGNFDNDSDWTKGTGITISGGSANFTGVSGQYLFQDINFVSGKVYEITFNVLSGSGTLTVFLGAANNVSPSSYSIGENKIVATGGGVNSEIYFGSAFTGSIDNISVVEVVGNKSRLNYDLLNGKVVNCPHYLLEPQSTNLLTQSNNNFIINQGSISYNSAISPTGENNAFKLTATGIDPFISQNATTTSTTFALSVYAKGVGNTIGKECKFLLIRDSYAEAKFGTNFILTDKWKRFETTLTLSSAPSSYVQWRFDAPDVSEIGDETLIFGGQLEALSYATSYIPTNGTAITRAAESATGSGDAATFNDSEGVLMAEISALANDGTFRFLGLSDGTTSNRVSVYFDNSNKLSASVPDVAAFSSNVNIKDNNKVAFKYKSGGYSFYVNGFELGTSTSTAGLHSGLNTLNFDFGGGSDDFYGNTRELQYFDSALTDAQLETLTSWTSLQEMITSQLYTNY